MSLGRLSGGVDRICAVIRTDGPAKTPDDEHNGQESEFEELETLLSDVSSVVPKSDAEDAIPLPSKDTQLAALDEVFDELERSVTEPPNSPPVGPVGSAFEWVTSAEIESVSDGD